MANARYELRQLPLVRSLGQAQLWLLVCPAHDRSSGLHSRRCIWSEKKGLAFVPWRSEMPLSPVQRCALSYSSLSAAKRACESKGWCDGVTVPRIARSACSGYSAARIEASRKALHDQLSQRLRGRASRPQVVKSAAELGEEAARTRFAQFTRRPKNDTLDHEKHFEAIGLSEQLALEALDRYPRFRGTATDGIGAKCSGTVVMVENRDLHNATKYYVRSIAANRAYALAHNYSFVLLRPQAGPWIRALRSARHAVSKGVPWCKIKALRRLVGRKLAQREQGTCSWIILFDSDSLVRRHEVPLAQFVQQRASPAELVVAREEPLPEHNFTYRRAG